MRVLISGGGTGGHIYPALAVATHLRDTYNADILYLGSDDGLETQLVPAAGFRIATVKAGKLRRYISWQMATGVARVPVGMVQAVGIVRKFQPHVAFTSGGYVAVPAGLAAKLNAVPLVIHQQDVSANLSNKLIAPFATRISVAFADSTRFFPAAKTLVLGNPVRQAILDVRQVTKQQARTTLGLDPALPLLLVTGGSQGARYLNQVTVQALPELLPCCQVLQISGNKFFEETRAQAEQGLANLPADMKQRYRLVPYMSDEMPLALQAAELVLCRAGAATLSELAVLGKASILVPLPPAIGGSPQEVNAAMFGQQGAAEVMHNADLKPQLLIERVRYIISTPSCLDAMTSSASGFAKPEATREIGETVFNAAKGMSKRAVKHEGINV